MRLREKFLKAQSPEMAFSLVSRYITFLVLCGFFFSALSSENVDAKPPFSFSIERFEKNHSFDSEIALYGDAEISDSTVRITRPAISSEGRIIYKKPIRFLGRNPGFSTYFSFSISPGNGHGLAFLVVPCCVPLKSTDGHRFGVSPSVLAIEFVTDPSGNHIEIDFGGEISNKRSNLSAVNLILNSGQKLHSWIDYDGVSKKLEVRLSKSRALRPSASLISYPIDLSSALMREAMFVGISSSSRNSTQTSGVYSWSFVVKHGAPYLMHSEPLDPHSFLVQSHESPPIHLRSNYPWKFFMALLFGAACGTFVAFVVFFLRSAAVNRHPVAPIEYPEHPVEIGYEKIVLGGDKVVDNAAK